MQRGLACASCGTITHGYQHTGIHTDTCLLTNILPKHQPKTEHTHTPLPTCKTGAARIQKHIQTARTQAYECRGERIQTNTQRNKHASPKKHEIKASACEESHRADPRTPARRQLADALVEVVGHEHVAARIDGNANRSVEAGAGPGTISIIGIAIARKRGNHCPLTSKHHQHNHRLHNPPPPTTPQRKQNR